MLKDFFQLKVDIARNILTGFGRIGGSTVGIIAKIYLLDVQILTTKNL